MRIAPLLGLALIFASTLAGCSNDDGADAPRSDGGVDATPSDLGIVDGGQDARPDASGDAALLDGGEDSGEVDGGEVDSGEVDSGEVDSGEVDSGVADAGDPDASPGADGGLPCDYLDLDIFIVLCPGAYEYLRGWQDLNLNPACPPYTTLLGNTYSSTTAAIAGEGCSSTCLYRAGISVSFIDHCGHRNGYIIYQAANGCMDLYEFSNGIFFSVAAWEAATPCPP